jgi:hypothetical protein
VSGTLFGIVFVFGLVAVAPWAILEILCPIIDRRNEALAEAVRRYEDISARADHEHRALTEGDVRVGIYGQYPPEEFS